MSSRHVKFALLCLVSSSLALAQTDGPPPTPPGDTPTAPTTPTPKMFEPKFGVVFNLQNIFQNASLLSGFRGGLGVQFPINRDLALRISASLSHSSNPAVVTTTTTTVNDMTTTTRTMTRPSPTSTFGVMAGADLLQQLISGPLAPYAGGGLWVSFDSQATVWRDDVTSMNQVTSVNDSTIGFAVGGRGVLGVGWRLHPHFLIFAEYALNLSIVDHTSDTSSQEVTVMGNPPASSRSQSANTRLFDFSTALSQGASLGLVAFFGN